MNIYLANPRGFCAGVDRAIDIVERALEIAGPHVAFDSLDHAVGLFHRRPHSVGAHDHVAVFGRAPDDPGVGHLDQDGDGLTRRQVGMVFQKPNPFPKSIYENIAYGPRIHGLSSNKAELDEIVETSLVKAGLWDEVKDWLDQPGTGLSGGQQQRLCIARTIAVNPEVILMDEPCSALDPIATAVIEDLIDELREQFTIVIVTHSMQQASRVSQRTAYFHLGDLIEVGPTAQIFTNPSHQLTEDYITGRFG